LADFVDKVQSARKHSQGSENASNHINLLEFHFAYIAFGERNSKKNLPTVFIPTLSTKSALSFR
jgi:hypothetical protein